MHAVQRIFETLRKIALRSSSTHGICFELELLLHNKRVFTTFDLFVLITSVSNAITMSLAKSFLIRCSSSNNMCLIRARVTPLTLVCPSRYMARHVIKKRITRLPSDMQVHQEEIDDNQMGPNDTVPINLINRNPRNLEQLSIEQKPLGWALEATHKTFWNK